MRKGNIFWGLVIIFFGFLLLLNTLGIFHGSIWRIFGPCLLIILGVWFLLRPVIYRGYKPESENITIPLSGISKGKIKIDYGAGKMNLSSTPDPSIFLTGEFLEGVEMEQNLLVDLLEVKLKAPAMFMAVPFPPAFEGYHWNVGLNKDVPIALEIHSGATETELNLADLKISDLRLETGASSTIVTLPQSAGMTRVEVHAGAASVTFHVPANVAARIQLKGGLSGEKIDTGRFPANSFGYESPDFESAANRVEIYAETGMGSIEVY